MIEHCNHYTDTDIETASAQFILSIDKSSFEVEHPLVPLNKKVKHFASPLPSSSRRMDQHCCGADTSAWTQTSFEQYHPTKLVAKSSAIIGEATLPTNIGKSGGEGCYSWPNMAAQDPIQNICFSPSLISTPLPWTPFSTDQEQVHSSLTSIRSAVDTFGRRASMPQISGSRSVAGQAFASSHKHSGSVDTSLLVNNFSNPYTMRITEQRRTCANSPFMTSTSSAKGGVRDTSGERLFSARAFNSLVGASGSHHHHHQDPHHCDSCVLPNIIQLPAFPNKRADDIDCTFEELQPGFIFGHSAWTCQSKIQHSEPSYSGIGSKEEIVQLNQYCNSETTIHDFNPKNLARLALDEAPQMPVSPSSIASLYPNIPTSSSLKSSKDEFPPGSLSNRHTINLTSIYHPLDCYDPVVQGKRDIYNFSSQIQSTSTSQQFIASQPKGEDNTTLYYDSALDLKYGCGFCGFQPANVTKRSCGHSICNTCHQYETQIYMQPSQYAAPPCLLRAYGLTPTSGGAQKDRCSSTNKTSNGNSSKQQRHLSWPQLASRRHKAQQPLGNNIIEDYFQGSWEGNVAKARGYGDKPQYSNQYHHASLGHNTMTKRPTAQSTPTFIDHQQHEGSPSSDCIPQPQLQSPHQTLKSGYGVLPEPMGIIGSNSQRLGHHYHQQYPIQAPLSGGIYASGSLQENMQQRSSSNSDVVSADSSEALSSLTTRCRERAIDHSCAQKLHSGHMYPLKSPQPPRCSQQQQLRGRQQHINQACNEGLYGKKAEQQAIDGVAGTAKRSIKDIGFSPSMTASSASLQLPKVVAPTPRTKAVQWAVIRVTNIPWDISLQDMLSFFSGLPHPAEHLLCQNVHIPMDRSTGKTFNSAFIELALTPREAGIAAQARNLKVLKGRVVMVELSNQDELMSSLFPKWRGQFQHGEPIVPGEHLRAQGEPLDVAKSTIGDTAENAVSSSTSIAKAAPRMVDTPPFVAREEISSLLTICRNYKIHFSRKCAERPFENIISILAKYPWHQAHRVLPLQRDHIFELLKLSIESLRVHLSKEYNTIHPTLLIRLVRSAIYTPAFTEKQKAMVLCTAGCPCPEDIVGWMAAPTSNDASKAVEASLPPLQSQAFEPDGQERACQSSAINKGDQNNHLAEAFANCDEEVIENFAVGDPFETGIMHIRDHHALSADSQSSTMSRASPPSTLSTAQIQKDSPNSRVLCIQDFFSCGVGSKGGKTSNPASGVVAAPMVKEAAIDEYSAKASSSPVMTRCTKSLSSSSSSSILSHISLPTGIPLSMSPPTPNKVATSFSIPRTVVGSEKVKSGTILDAIKTITQSTPRLHRQTYCGTDMI